MACHAFRHQGMMVIGADSWQAHVPEKKRSFHIGQGLL
jgi:hypothetical protein